MSDHIEFRAKPDVYNELTRIVPKNSIRLRHIQAAKRNGKPSKYFIDGTQVTKETYEAVRLELLGEQPDE